MKVRVWDLNDERMYYDVTTLDNTSSYFMQSTGIKDKNNREIYLSDIVEFEDYHGKEVGVIEAIGVEFHVVGHIHDHIHDLGRFFAELLSEVKSVTVIGNVFENLNLKELL